MAAPPPVDDRRDLRADCSRCVGLCCVVPAFAASADFAIDKPAGTPCPNLRSDRLCGIHAHLRDEGFPGCVAYDCFGAGQRVVATSPDGARDPAAVGPAFRVVQGLHEILWYLTEAAERLGGSPPAEEVAAAHARVDGAAARAAAGGRVDLDAERAAVGPLLGRVSGVLRHGTPAPDRTRADLVGTDLRAVPLVGASLRGALLLGADLRDVDLDRADLLGADLRGADLRGAHLATALFLTAPQLAGARTDARTTVPRAVAPPAR